MSGGDAPPNLELVEQPRDAVAPAALYKVVRRRVAAVGLGGDHRLHLGVGRFMSDRVGIVALVGDHAHQRPEALNIMRLPWRLDEGE